MNDVTDERPFAPEVAPAAPPNPGVEPGNAVFPVPLRRFLEAIRHTADEVWGEHLRIQHGRENHTMDDWRALLEGHRNTPAHPGP